MSSNIGKKLRNFRNEKGYTLKQLSDLSKISISFISDIENERRNPSIDTLQSLADALNIPIDEFFQDKKTSIGENIKKFRKERGLTQKELAEKCNLSRSYLADLERNRYNPSLESLKLISDSLNVDISVLLGKCKLEEVENNSKTNIDKLEEDFPEGVYVLRRASKELSPEARKQMIKIMKTFLEEDDE